MELKLIPDPDMYIFFEKGTTGGVSYISNRYSKANNKYVESYDLNLESKDIIYLDANKLYGHAMSKFLPTSGFKWMNLKEFSLNKYSSNSLKGYIVEVDPKCRKELQEFYNDYLLAPNKIGIKKEAARLSIKDC